MQPKWNLGVRIDVEGGGVFRICGYCVDQMKSLLLEVPAACPPGNVRESSYLEEMSMAVLAKNNKDTSSTFMPTSDNHEVDVSKVVWVRNPTGVKLPNDEEIDINEIIILDHPLLDIDEEKK
jgi:hypothetical protein